MRLSTIFATASLFLSSASALTIPRRYGRADVARRDYDEYFMERMLDEYEDSRLVARNGNPGLQALSVLSPTLQKLGVQYAVLGGAASAALGSDRVTNDIDVVVVPKGQLDAYTLSNQLLTQPGWSTVTEHGVPIPAIKVGSTLVPVEIFDPPSWPQRPQYNGVTTDATVVTLSDGVKVSVFNAAWQLKEKIATFHQRGKVGTPKAASDLQDIRFLASKIPAGDYQKGLLLLGPGEHKDAFQAILKRPDMPKDLAAALAKIVKA
ncbi:hypothetical protein BKA70DRAFT_1196690 [Coprinopsis sp. MPI-PUGE-AT-0042]|nr:hypothetical protein BKA70DRAFT_1196690 [Coprinopsis sp. MPI-PUGE-AT-0042]